MSTPTIPYYPITHDDGLNIIDALDDIKDALSATTVWGDITGSLSNQTDLQNALDGKTPLASGVLRFTNQGTSATSSSAVFCTINNSAITAKHVVVDLSFNTPANITSGITWSTSAGKVTLTGINTSANTTVSLTLALAGNL